MYLEVYPDIIFILNFIIDFILLFILRMINRKGGRIVRLLVAAAIGGITAAIAGVFPWMNAVIRFIVLNLISAVIMLSVAFGKMKKADLIRQVIVLYFITYFLGGLLNSAYYYTDLRLYLIYIGNTLIFSDISWKYVIIPALVLLPAAILILWLLRLHQNRFRQTLETELVLNGRTIRTKGFLDTGNCLYDPIFQKPVIIIEDILLKELLPPELYQEFHGMESCLKESAPAMESLKTEAGYTLNLRVIPFQSIGKPNGMMLGLVLDKVSVTQGKKMVCCEKVTAAICDDSLSAGGDYHVLLHKGLLQALIVL